MSTADQAVERAIVDAALRVLHRRAAALRKVAGDLTTEIEHHGRMIPIAAPDASTALDTARLLEDCAAEVAALLPGRPGDDAQADVGAPPRLPAPAGAPLS